MTTTNTAPAAAADTTEIKSTVIRPGWLVSVNTKLTGGVEYRRIALDASGEPALPGAEVTRWETIKTVLDPVEYDRATKVRSKARTLITKVCHGSAFGDLCPETQIGALDAAAREARRIVAEFNAGSKHSEISIFVLKGHVASDDAEAAQAITAEIADLVTQMQTGIEALDTKAIRDAADRAREISAMLDESTKGKVDAAIEQARKAARAITKRIEKAGEDKALVLMDIQRGAIESARITFLDMSAAVAPSGDALPAVEAQRFADLDMSDEEIEAGLVEAAEDMGLEVVRGKLDLAGGSEPVAVAAAAAGVRMMELS